jgi:hypothetical protein
MPTANDIQHMIWVKRWEDAMKDPVLLEQYIYLTKRNEIAARMKEKALRYKDNCTFISLIDYHPELKGKEENYDDE